MRDLIAAFEFNEHKKETLILIFNAVADKVPTVILGHLYLVAPYLLHFIHSKIALVTSPFIRVKN